SLTLTQTAIGGAGGASGNNGGAGGAASSTLTVRGASASSLAVSTVAAGGAGGGGETAGGAGGNASARSDATLIGAGRVSSTATATAGSDGGQVLLPIGSGASSAQSAAANAEGSVTAAARAGASAGRGAVGAETETAVGAGTWALAPIASGQAISDANLTPGGPTIGGGAISGSSQCCERFGLERTLADEAEFSFIAAARERLSLTLLDNDSAGTGFDRISLKVAVDGRVAVVETFTSLSVAEAFFSHRALDLGVAGPGDHRVDVSYAITTGGFSLDGFGFAYSVQDGAVPEPATWAMMLLGLAGLSYAGHMKSKDRRLDRLAFPCGVSALSRSLDKETRLFLSEPSDVAFADPSLPKEQLYAVI
ncbi:putative secreted protein with PEP-CTERM sorting signal, partial [Roseiarcus fermentans]